MIFRNLFTLIFIFAGLIAVQAQEDCDCDEPQWDAEGICVEVEDNGMLFTLWAPDECHAECFFGEDYTIVECNDDGWEWEDECDCPEDDWNSEGICIEVVDMVFDSSAYITWVPSECYAECWFEEYTLADCDDLPVWEDECDCPEEDWNSEGFCIEVVDVEYDTTGYITWVPSECYAACWFEEYTLTDCDDGWGWEDECDCPEDDWETEGICIEVIDMEYDSSAYITWVPSECYAACWFEDYTIAECDDGWGWEDDCDCPEEDWNLEGFCVETDGYITWVPSECYAECWYEDYTIVDCDEGGYGEGGECDWDLDCECEIDSEEGICIAYIYSDSLFGMIDTLIEWVPNECFAECWGFEDYVVVDCEDLWDWEEEDTGIEIEGDAECIIALLEAEDLTFQGFLYGLHECDALVLDECVLAAPIFETDEEFINYLIENCPEWFGFVMDESDGPSLFTSFGQSQEGNPISSTYDIEGLDLKVLGNPVVDQLNISMNTAESIDLEIIVSSSTGNVLNVDLIQLAKGEHLYELNTKDFSAGLYSMTINNKSSSQTLKFVVIK